MERSVNELSKVPIILYFMPLNLLLHLTDLTVASTVG